MASEVLSCDLSAMQDILLSVSSGLVEQVLAILQQPPPLAPVLAGYCSKVIVGLFKSAPEQFTQFFTDHWAAQPDSLIRCVPSVRPAPARAERQEGPGKRGRGRELVDRRGGLEQRERPGGGGRRGGCTA